MFVFPHVEILSRTKLHDQNKIELRLQRALVLRCVGVVPDRGNRSQFVID